MTATYAIRATERDDQRALTTASVWLQKKGLRFDPNRKIAARRNGGLWQYEIPVEEHIGL